MKKTTRAQTTFALLAPLACMMLVPAVAQNVASPIEIASSSSATGFPTLAKPATTESAASRAATTQPATSEIDAPQPQPVALDLGAEPIPSSEAVPMDQPGGYRVAPIHRKYILTDMRAQTLTSRDKVIIGLQGTYSLMNFGGMIVAAGWEQLRNGQPNYGTDSGAFGERLGAAAIRGTSQGVFTDSVFAPLLHEDPRYYVEGKQYGIVHRALYAATRPVITRTDSGRRTINGAQLLGYAASTALNNAFYPPSNRNVKDNLEAYAGSIGGSALCFVLTEFTASMWHVLHLGR
jgi:hypothetical protein